MKTNKDTNAQKTLKNKQITLTDQHGQCKVQHCMHSEGTQIGSEDVPGEGPLLPVEIIPGPADRRADVVTAQRQLDDPITQAEAGEHTEQVAQLQGLARGLRDRGEHEGDDHQTQACDEVQEHHHDLRSGVAGQLS